MAAYTLFLISETCVRSHHREVMHSLREESEKIACLIRERDIDRKALSTAAGRIGTITWRELNV